MMLEIYSQPVFQDAPKSAPVVFSSGAAVAQKGCATPSETTKGKWQWRKLRHSASPGGAAEALPLSPSSGFADRLAHARKMLAEWSSELAELDTVLTPAWDEERSVKDKIAATHKRSEHGVITLNLDGRDNRAPLFGKLLRIAEQWGKTKEQRRHADRRCRSLAREINMLTKLIEKGRQRPNGRAA